MLGLRLYYYGSIYARDGSSVKTNNLSSINTGRAMRRTTGESCSSSRIYTGRMIRLSVARRHEYKSNRRLDQIGGNNTVFKFSECQHTFLFGTTVDLSATDAAILSLYFTARRPLALCNEMLIVGINRANDFDFRQYN